MRIANISTVKNELSKYLRYVQMGEKVRILDRNQAVADLVPVVQSSDTSTESHLHKLEANGVIRRGSGVLPKDFCTLPKKPTPNSSYGVLEAMIQERKEGR